MLQVELSYFRFELFALFEHFEFFEHFELFEHRLESFEPELKFFGLALGTVFFLMWFGFLFFLGLPCFPLTFLTNTSITKNDRIIVENGKVLYCNRFEVVLCIGGMCGARA